MRTRDLREGAVVMVTRDSPPGIGTLHGYYGAMGTVEKYGWVNFGRGGASHAYREGADVSWSFSVRDLVLLEAAR